MFYILYVVVSRAISFQSLENSTTLETLDMFQPTTDFGTLVLYVKFKKNKPCKDSTNECTLLERKLKKTFFKKIEKVKFLKNHNEFCLKSLYIVFFFNCTYNTKVLKSNSDQNISRVSKVLLFSKL